MAMFEVPDDLNILTALSGALWNAAHYHFGVVYVAQHDGAKSINLNDQQIAVARQQGEWMLAAAEQMQHEYARVLRKAHKP